MAVTFSSGDSLLRTTSLPSTPLTVMGWFRLDSDNGALNNAMAFGDATGADYCQLGADMATNTWLVWDGDSSHTGSAVSTLTWYHLTLVVPTLGGGGAVLGYVNATLDITASSLDPAVTSEELWVGNDHDAEVWIGRAAGVKCWSGVALTATEIRTEMQQYVPVRWANLYGFWPLWSAADAANDYGASARAWTVGGTLVTSEGPPIPWNVKRRSRARLMTITPPVLPTATIAWWKA